MTGTLALGAPYDRDVTEAETWLSAARVALAVPEADQSAARALQNVVVIGAGTMGRDIAAALALAGRTVTLTDPSADAREAAETRITSILDKASPPVTRPVITGDTEALAQADLVIEAVPEIPALKKTVLADAAHRTRPGTLIATNTSTLDLDDLASSVPEPGHVIGTHFFMPAHVTRLIELVPAAATCPATIATARGLAHMLGKIPVVAGNCDGFIGNRLFDRLHQEAMYLVEEGAWPEDVDAALEDWGMKIGPFRTLDMIGNDVPHGVRRRRAVQRPGILQPLVGDRLCDAGLMGQKSMKGWYIYDTRVRRGRPYEEGRAVVIRSSADLGLVRRPVGRDEVITRCLTALILEAFSILADGMAQAPSDIDVVYVTGYGFPAAKGGPYLLARTLGAEEIYALAGTCAARSARHRARWACPAALEDLLDPDQYRRPGHAL